MEERQEGTDEPDPSAQEEGAATMALGGEVCARPVPLSDKATHPALLELRAGEPADRVCRGVTGHCGDGRRCGEPDRRDPPGRRGDGSEQQGDLGGDEHADEGRGLQEDGGCGDGDDRPPGQGAQQPRDRRHEVTVAGHAVGNLCGSVCIPVSPVERRPRPPLVRR